MRSNDGGSLLSVRGMGQPKNRGGGSGRYFQNPIGASGSRHIYQSFSGAPSATGTLSSHVHGYGHGSGARSVHPPRQTNPMDGVLGRRRARLNPGSQGSAMTLGMGGGQLGYGNSNGSGINNNSSSNISSNGNGTGKARRDSSNSVNNIHGAASNTRATEGQMGQAGGGEHGAGNGPLAPTALRSRSNPNINAAPDASGLHGGAPSSLLMGYSTPRSPSPITGAARDATSTPIVKGANQLDVDMGTPAADRAQHSNAAEMVAGLRGGHSPQPQAQAQAQLQPQPHPHPHPHPHEHAAQPHAQASLRQSLTGELIVIHVCDEDRGLKRDFHCRRELLLEHMRYFRSFIDENSSQDDVDISVHCDVHIFEWLMEYVHSVNSPPKLDPSCVISILISSDFLQMDPLTELCLKYITAHLSEVIRVPIDMGCIKDELLVRLAALTEPEVLAYTRDKRDKLLSKLYKKRIEMDFRERQKGVPHSISACRYCLQPFATKSEAQLRCPAAPISVDFAGGLVARHAPAGGWSLTKFVGGLHNKGISWERIYWYLWGLTHHFNCSACGLTFNGAGAANLCQAQAAKKGLRSEDAAAKSFDPAMDLVTSEGRIGGSAGAQDAMSGDADTKDKEGRRAASDAHTIAQGTAKPLTEKLLHDKRDSICMVGKEDIIKDVTRNVLESLGFQPPFANMVRVGDVPTTGAGIAEGSAMGPLAQPQRPRMKSRSGRRRAAAGVGSISNSGANLTNRRASTGGKPPTPTQSAGGPTSESKTVATASASAPQQAGNDSNASTDDSDSDAVPPVAKIADGPKPAPPAADEAKKNKPSFCGALSPFLPSSDADDSVYPYAAGVVAAPRASVDDEGLPEKEANPAVRIIGKGVAKAANAAVAAGSLGLGLFLESDPLLYGAAAGEKEAASSPQKNPREKAIYTAIPARWIVPPAANANPAPPTQSGGLMPPPPPVPTSPPTAGPPGGHQYVHPRLAGSGWSWMCMSSVNVLGAQPHHFNRAIHDASHSRQSFERQRQWVMDLQREHDYKRMMNLGRALRSRRGPAAAYAKAAMNHGDAAVV
uniref:SANT and BTB domain-containing protein n=1 Tax=Phaeomonas parva TaxID=124430 RepID=A0A7S1XVF4_9STRA|mmetsp:Transcript_36502/g.114417  ORF Transcript_36502/g.114417 Transcript_36502/m.114417 type:complete len:1058 (+) Transcript_36502:209-3382(+)